MQSNHSLPYYEVAREPPPYPSSLKPYCQPGYRQSYSGSEASTDFSLSSTENLSISARQEPQGEETFQRSSPYYPLETCCMQDAGVVSVTPSSSSSTHSLLSSAAQGMQDGVEVKSMQGAFYVTGSNMLQQLSQVAPPAVMQKYQTLDVPTTAAPMYDPKTNSKHWSPNQSVNSFSGNSQCSPTALLSDFSAEKGMAQKQRVAPPQYPGTALQHQLQYTMNEKKEMQRSYEVLDKLKLTRSQPDLTQLMKYSVANQTFDFPIQPNTRQHVFDSQFTPKQSPRLPKKSAMSMSDLEIDHAAIANRATQLVEMLTEENKSLRDELDNLYHKVSRLQKLEAEIHKVSDAHESLVKQAGKREMLETAMRKKLEQDLAKQQDLNKNLKNQLQRTLAQLTGKDTGLPEAQHTQDLEKKDSTITKLLEKNKELTAKKKKVPTATLC